jgi:methyltransferase-like protein
LHKAAIALLEGVDFPLADEPATRLEDMAATVMEVYLGGAIELSLHPPKVASTISALPAVSPMVRLQASAHGKVVSQLHETIVLDEFRRHVVARLDGEHDPDGLWLDLARAIDRGEIELASKSMESLDDILEWCRARALLVE